jgi:hypothetical protein
MHAVQTTVPEPDSVAHTPTAPAMGDMLCQRCSVLSFDDRIFRDFVGEDYAIPLYDDEVNQRLNELLGLNYELTDTFPGLPRLAASVETGCAFCKALREATLEENLDLPATCIVTYRIRYVWSPTCAPLGIGL